MFVTDSELFESEDADIETHRVIGITNRQDEVIEPIDGRPATLGGSRCGIVDESRNDLASAVDHEFEDIRAGVVTNRIEVLAFFPDFQGIEIHHEHGLLARRQIIRIDHPDAVWSGHAGTALEEIRLGGCPEFRELR
jgi:hypothetical protein